jgi:hypothetical protein
MLVGFDTHVPVEGDAVLLDQVDQGGELVAMLALRQWFGDVVRTSSCSFQPLGAAFASPVMLEVLMGL